jgi:hypothetical protein
MPRGFELCALAALCVCGCEGTTGLTGGAVDAASEGSAADATPEERPDAPSPSDAGSDTLSDGGESNLLRNGSFEDGVGGCGPGWTNVYGTIQRSNEAHTGSSSCMLCGPGGLIRLARTSGSGATGRSGDSFYLEVWGRLLDDAGGGSRISLEALVTPADGGAAQSYASAPAGTAQAWTVYNWSFALREDTSELLYDVDFAPGLDGPTQCVLLDDALMVKQ